MLACECHLFTPVYYWIALSIGVNAIKVWLVRVVYRRLKRQSELVAGWPEGAITVTLQSPPLPTQPTCGSSLFPSSLPTLSLSLSPRLPTRLRSLVLVSSLSFSLLLPFLFASPLPPPSSHSNSSPLSFNPAVRCNQDESAPIDLLSSVFDPSNDSFGR